MIMSKMGIVCANNSQAACDFLGWDVGVAAELGEPTSLSEQLDLEVSRRVLDQRGKTISQWTKSEEQLVCLLNYGTVIPEYRGDISVLEETVEKSNEEGFIRAIEGIDWSQKSAAEFARAARLALSVGVYLIARRLAEQGTKLHPHNAELRKMAQIFAPPRLISTVPPQSAVQSNDEWLRNHAAEYRGQWVAVKAGKLLATEGSLKELNEQIENISDTLLTKL